MIAVIFRGELAASEHRQLLECALKRDAAGAQRVLVRQHPGLRDLYAGERQNRAIPAGSAVKRPSAPISTPIATE